MAEARLSKRRREDDTDTSEASDESPPLRQNTQRGQPLRLTQQASGQYLPSLPDEVWVKIFSMVSALDTSRTVLAFVSLNRVLRSNQDLLYRTWAFRKNPGAFALRLQVPSYEKLYRQFDCERSIYDPKTTKLQAKDNGDVCDELEFAICALWESSCRGEKLTAASYAWIHHVCCLGAGLDHKPRLKRVLEALTVLVAGAMSYWMDDSLADEELLWRLARTWKAVQLFKAGLPCFSKILSVSQEREEGSSFAASVNQLIHKTALHKFPAARPHLVAALPAFCRSSPWSLQPLRALFEISVPLHTVSALMDSLPQTIQVPQLPSTIVLRSSDGVIFNLPTDDGICSSSAYLADYITYLSHPA